MDRSVAKVRQKIEDCVSEISTIRQELNASSEKTRISMRRVLQDVLEQLHYLRDDLWNKTKAQPEVRDPFEAESVAAVQGSRNNPYTVESSPGPETKKPGTRDDPFVIESSPEPEPRSEGEVRWVSDDLKDALELESQLLREGWYDGAEAVDEDREEAREEIEEDIDENFDVERQIRSEVEAA
jgi:hypothetical protein